jgi:hypothetical protein
MKNMSAKAALCLTLLIPIQCARAQLTLTTSNDWYQRWQKQSWDNIAKHLGRHSGDYQNYWIYSTHSDIAQRLSYEPSQYIIPSYLYASQVPAIPQLIRDSCRLDADTFLSHIFGDTPPYDFYLDVPPNIAGQPNGLDDGYKGWSNRGYTSLWCIDDVISKNTYHPMRIRVTDNGASGTCPGFRSGHTSCNGGRAMSRRPYSCTN